MFGPFTSEEKLSISLCCLSSDHNDFLIDYKQIGKGGPKWKEFMCLSQHKFMACASLWTASCLSVCKNGQFLGSVWLGGITISVL